MILGLGSDICDIRRVEAVIAQHGDRFLQRVFTPVERARAGRRTEKIQAATYAKRFAAKEAAAKALGTGFRKGVFFSDLGVVNLPGGQPTLHMTGGAADRLAAITPRGDARDGRPDDDRRISLCVCAGDHFGGADLARIARTVAG